VTKLSRPGSNLTGIFVRQLELAAKRVEIARETFPRATVVESLLTRFRASNVMQLPRRPASKRAWCSKERIIQSVLS
jgi:hypothetical protein